VRTIEELTDSAHDIVVNTYDQHVRPYGTTLVANVVLFSGGGDSTALLDVMHATGLATHIAHVDTTIGIPETREHVDRVAASYGLPFIVESPDPGDRYEDIILTHGFPGPGGHYKAYQRLKERALRKVRAQLVANGRTERVMFLAGRRRDESARRSAIPESSREGSIVWCSPLFDWTNDEIAAYKSQRNLPVNPVAEHLHMSGECLCGAFAKPGELDEIAFFYPAVAERIRRLEVTVAESGAPPERCKWGWGAYRRDAVDENQMSLIDDWAPLCSTCEWRADAS
jgi:3'-phosphoadenosine 5'-phosphosulfate sulfotransferase (PAPS reductase)/FAD synthetase